MRTVDIESNENEVSRTYVASSKSGVVAGSRRFGRDRPSSKSGLDRPPSKFGVDGASSESGVVRGSKGFGMDRPSSKSGLDRPPSKFGLDGASASAESWVVGGSSRFGMDRDGEGSVPLTAANDAPRRLVFLSLTFLSKPNGSTSPIAAAGPAYELHFNLCLNTEMRCSEMRLQTLFSSSRIG